MKKLLAATTITVIAAVALFGSISMAFAASDSAMSIGPAPNAGDGISDGSGLEAPFGGNGEIGSGSGPAGPAPNSGDGIPDGSGF